MIRQSRRQFLGRALAAGAGATVLEPFVVGDPDARAVPAGTLYNTPNVDSDPNFLLGRVVDTGSGGTIAVLDPQGCSHVTLAKPDSGGTTWKLGVLNALPVVSGDVIYARGTPGSDGVFAFNRLWANIDNFRAEVIAVGASSLSLLELKTGQALTVNVGNVTKTILPDGTQQMGSVSGVQVGDPLQIVSAGDNASGERWATEITSLNALDSVIAQDQATHSELSPASSQRVATPDQPCCGCQTYHGVTSWFCCGSTCSQCAACGATCDCGSATSCCGCGSTGACSGCCSCYSGLNAIAWPLIYECNGSGCGNCGNTCGPYSGNCQVYTLPRENCCVCHYVARECTSVGLTCRVRDCGPTIHCVSAVCCGETKVAWDLTPCAYSALADLSSGLMAVSVSTSYSC